MFLLKKCLFSYVPKTFKYDLSDYAHDLQNYICTKTTKWIGCLLLLICFFRFPEHFYPRLGQHGELSNAERLQWLFMAGPQATLYIYCQLHSLPLSICSNGQQHLPWVLPAELRDFLSTQTYFANTVICIRVDGKIGEQCITGEEKKIGAVQRKPAQTVLKSERPSVDFLPGRWRMMLFHLLLNWTECCGIPGLSSLTNFKWG